MEKEELEVLEPQHGFYQVVVEVATEDSETGKVKKVKEVHLVDGVNPTDVEAKVAQEMEGTMWEWKITSMNVSKIQLVY